MKYLEINKGVPIFHKELGLGVVAMNSYQDEDWARVEFKDSIESVFKRDLVDSEELILIFKSK